MTVELVVLSNHLIPCHLPLFLPSIFPSIRVFSSESATSNWLMYNNECWPWLTLSRCLHSAGLWFQGTLTLGLLLKSSQCFWHTETPYLFVKCFNFGAKVRYLNGQPADLLIILHPWCQVLWSDHPEFRAQSEDIKTVEAPDDGSHPIYFFSHFCSGWWKNVNVGLGIRMLVQPQGERRVFFVTWQACDGRFWHHGYF